MTPDLFSTLAPQPARVTLVPLAPGAVLLRQRALAQAEALLAGVAEVTAVAPFRWMSTPNGYRMSVAMTNCGALGWVSDATGYRYAPLDPARDAPWPAMPAAFLELARQAAADAGFPAFEPDACLVNRYAPGARLSLHQDRNEHDFSQPIVSVSLGLPAVFQFGGLRRGDPVTRYLLEHGDVVVWGGPARLRYHGVLALKDGEHAATGACRINLTFRRAGRV